MNDVITSAIRTYTPILVGGLISWLLSLGVEVDPQSQAGLVIFLTGLLQALYWTVVRLLEKKWPALGVLLGKAEQPTYTKQAYDKAA